MEPWVMWAVFAIVVAAMFLADIGAVNRGSKGMTTRKAAAMTAAWVAVAAAFAAFVYMEYGSDKAMEFAAAYVIEEMMSVDNLFVFIVVFSFFAVPEAYQHKALFYGIAGAMALRAVFIFVGAAALERFDFVMYLFGIVLIITAVRTAFKKEDDGTKESAAVKMSRWFKSTPEYDGDRLFTRVDGVRLATPLFLCVIVIELSDVMFAFDSIPAVLSISTDTLIVYTSNIFAILGLRSLYFVLRGTMNSMRYMKYGLGVILAFVGAKMLLSEHFHIGVVQSLAFISVVLLATIALSMAGSRAEAAQRDG